jgi:LmbE family N-acetylglucosaminyl deacetylase
MKKILCVAAHPDDEVLGCGGTLAKFAREGAHIRTVIVAEGITSRSTKRSTTKSSRELDLLRKQTEAAAKILGVKGVDFLQLPDNRLDSLDLLDVIKPLESIIAKFKPNMVFTHFAGDLNVDHQIVNKAVLTACRPLPGSSIEKIFEFEVLSSTGWSSLSGPQFTPQVSVDISKFLVQKERALEIYQGEMRPFPHARSIECVLALAKLRGGQVGFSAAEAFQLTREIVK